MTKKPSAGMRSALSFVLKATYQEQWYSKQLKNHRIRCSTSDLTGWLGFIGTFQHKCRPCRALKTYVAVKKSKLMGKLKMLRAGNMQNEIITMNNPSV